MRLVDHGRGYLQAYRARRCGIAASLGMPADGGPPGAVGLALGSPGLVHYNRRRCVDEGRWKCICGRSARAQCGGPHARVAFRRSCGRSAAGSAAPIRAAKASSKAIERSRSARMPPPVRRLIASGRDPFLAHLLALPPEDVRSALWHHARARVDHGVRGAHRLRWRCRVRGP